MTIMIVVISYLMNTMHPNQNDKNYNTILAFLLGCPGWLCLPGWPGWLAGMARARALGLFHYLDYPGTIQKL